MQGTVEEIKAAVRAELYRRRDEAARRRLEEQAAEREAVARELKRRKAQTSAGHFGEYAFVAEKTGLHLVNAGFHWEWHAFLDENRWAVLFAPVEHAKSTQIGLVRLLHEIGKNPNGRFAIIGDSEDAAAKILGVIAQSIEENEEVREVFPHLRRSTRKRDPWHKTAITVQRDRPLRDPTLRAYGRGSPILGSRLDGVIIDDILNLENTSTDEQIEKTINWLESTVLSRLTDGAFCWFIGTPWHVADALHEFAKRKGFASRRYSAVKNPEDPQSAWVPLWPEQFSRERLAKIAAVMLAINFARSYLCQVRADADSRFRAEWIEWAKQAGKGRTMLDRAPRAIGSGKELPCFTGVDLGVATKAKAKKNSGLTVLTTIALVDNGKRLICRIEAGRWQSPEILSRIGRTHQAFNSIVMVEDNGAQQFIVSWAQAAGVPVVGMTTGANKTDEAFGVESIAVEMRSRMWIYPSGDDGQTLDPELDALIREQLFYRPEAHTGDRLMSKWFAVSAARSLARGMTSRAGVQDRR